MTAGRIEHRLKTKYYLLPEGGTKPIRTVVYDEKPVQQPCSKYILGNKLMDQFCELHDFNGDWSNLGEIARHLESKNSTSLSLIIEKIAVSKFFYIDSYQNGNKK